MVYLQSNYFANKFVLIFLMLNLFTKIYQVSGFIQSFFRNINCQRSVAWKNTHGCFDGVRTISDWVLVSTTAQILTVVNDLPLAERRTAFTGERN